MKLRLAGVATLLVCLLLYNFESEALVDRLVLPIAAAIGAWMMVKNATAVCLVASFLSLAHTDLSSDDWIASLAYPLVAAFCGAWLVVIVIARFANRINETHEARWQNRKRNTGEGE